MGALLLVVVGGISIGLGVSWGPSLTTLISAHLSSTEHADMPDGDVSADDKPIYWVAPMDPNYRREGPGKSPMGMDLVPVYANGGEELPAGTVEISPSVINNMGVRTAKVESGMLDDAIETVGYVSFDEREVEEIHARVAGWLQQLHVRSDGEPVEQFDRLYDIYSPELVSAQEELLVALTSGDESLIRASEDKLSSLGVSNGTISRIRENRSVTQQVRVYAPEGGIVDSLSVGQGAYVTPGQRIMRIASMDPVWVEGEVFESQLAKLRTGATAQIEVDAVPGRRWQGKVDYIYPVLDSVTRTARFRVVLDNPDGALLPNMFTRLMIEADSEDQTLLVARDAVLRSGTMERVVLAVGEGRFKSVAVETGRRSREKVQILSGLESGDEVVISAQFLIDSESSISSDFLRMSELEAPPDEVWANGIVDDFYADEGIAAITHEPVPEWDWPGMSMEFSVDSSVDTVNMSAGKLIRFRMFKTDTGEYHINAIESIEQSGSLR